MSRALNELIDALSHPSAYPHHPSSVHLIQTHISVVFIADELVYKVKKPLNLGFLDFTDRDKRDFFCRQEVLLNSRFSEGIYLGVVPIHKGRTGINLIGDGEHVDSAVLMRHIPEDRLLITMLRDERITRDVLLRVADRIAAFHASAARGPAIRSFGSPEVIFENLRENFEQTRPFIDRTISREVHGEIERLSFEFLRSRTELFRERMRDGFIRDCHGDLHLDHVIILNGIMLYDCIEFNDRFRYGDTAADLAFLLMDLDFRGYPAYAETIAGHYTEVSGDARIRELLGFYKSYRAFVRGKVIGFTLEESEVPEETKTLAAKDAHAYFALARACLKPSPSPVLVVMTGLMGTGKSHLAARLADRLGIERLSSDRLRKEIHAVPADEHQLDKYGEGIYRAYATDRTYGALLDEALRRLQRGESVILDASFMRFRDRRRAWEAAREASARFRLVHCVCPEEEIRRRLEYRIKQAGQPSDGRWELFPEQKERFEPIRPDELDECRQWDSAVDIDEFLLSFVRELMFPL